MNQPIKTVTLAKIYEDQGYYEEAFDIYSFLKTSYSNMSDNDIDVSEDRDIEIRAGLNRMKEKMGEKLTDPDSNPTSNQNSIKTKKIFLLLEQWLNLLILEQRLKYLKKIKPSF